MNFRKAILVTAFVGALAAPASAAIRSDNPDTGLLPRIIHFIAAHVPPWLHVVPTDDFPLPPHP
jgi:hypothetical protein